MEDFTQRIDLLAERLGAAALLASDEFFAPKENLVRASDPVFRPDEYTERGKWMDGWESRRKRVPGHDWCVLRLGVPGIVRGVVVDTAHFRGNYPESCSIDACSVSGLATPDLLAAPSTDWIEILPRARLQGDTKNAFAIESPWCFTHVRLNIHPDGGVARLRVHGEPRPDWKRLARASGAVDLAAIENGAAVLATSDRFFGSAHNLLMPGPSVNMGDGWETRRRRGPGHDWAIVRLGVRGRVQQVEVDTAHFKGNFPESCSLEACEAADVREIEVGETAAAAAAAIDWRELLPRQKLCASTRHVFEDELSALDDISHVRFQIFPDGGVGRLRLHGVPSTAGRAAAGIAWLDALTPMEAQAELSACCGSSAWATALALARPLRTVDALHAAVERAFARLEPQGWLEAFGRHPRIGERLAERGASATAQRWSEEEQSGAHAASRATLAALADANRAYQARFGFVFLVCASGKSAEEMFTLCRSRLANAPEVELAVAAQEQRAITRLRLAKLVGAT